MKYIPFRTIVVYKTREYANNWITDFCTENYKAIEEVIDTSTGCDITLYDGSIVMLRPAIEGYLIGGRANRIYVDPQVNEDFVNTILLPMCINAQIIYDNNEQSQTPKT